MGDTVEITTTKNLDIEAECPECDSELDVRAEFDEYQTVKLEVSPCEKCLENARIQGRAEEGGKQLCNHGLGHQMQARVEHAAWRQICLQLAKLGIDINENDDLGYAMKMWGEELHQLRLLVPQHDADALTQARTQYDGRMLPETE